MLKTPYDISPKSVIESLPDFANAFDVTYKNYSNVNTSRGSIEILKAFDDDNFAERQIEPLFPFRYGSYLFYEMNN